MALIGENLDPAGGAAPAGLIKFKVEAISY